MTSYNFYIILSYYGFQIFERIVIRRIRIHGFHLCSWVHNYFIYFYFSFIYFIRYREKCLTFSSPISPVSKDPRHNFSNLISHHHQLETSSKKDSPFVLLSEHSQEGSISSHSETKLKNQSVSSANSDIDNDGNHNGRGYLCDCYNISN